MDKLRVGIIGCGFISHYHLESWKKSEEIEVIAACDMKEDNARKVADKFSINKVYTDGKEMLDREKLDIVDLAAPVNAHKDYFMSAAERKVHIVCEKPLAPSLSDAHEMADCASRNGVTTMVCQTYRWQPWLLEVKRVVDNGLIGTPFYANITQRIPFAVPSGPEGKIGIVEDQPFYLNVEKLLVLEMVSHYVDSLRFLFGEPTSVYAKITKISKYTIGEDLAILVLNFPELLGVIEDSWATAGQDVTNSIVVEGDKGIVRFAGTQGPPHAPTKRVPPLEIISSTGEVKTQQLDMTEFYLRSFEFLQRHFINCIKSKEEPITSVHDNLKTLRIVFGSYESAEQDSVIRF